MASTTIKLEMMTPGTQKWLNSSIEFAAKSLMLVDRDARHFYETSAELIENKAWDIYFEDEPKTWERFLTEAIGVEDVQETIDILRGVESALRAGVAGPIPAALAKSMYEGTQAIAEVAKPAMKHGGDRKSEDRNQADNYQVEKSYGTSAEYLASVIARDHPEIHEGMKAGKYRSVRQAAIEAGLVKPRDQWSAPGPIEKLAALIRKRYTPGEIADLITILQGTNS